MAKVNRAQKLFPLPKSDFTHAKELPSTFPQDFDPAQNRDPADLTYYLLKKGELCLLNGDLSGLSFFETAMKLDPENETLYCQQGLSLLEYGRGEGREKGLKLACACFKKATKLSPRSFEGWHHWSYALYLLGVRKKELSYFHHAKEKCERALSLKENQSVDSIADLYGNYGDIWAFIAEKSGEPADFCLALNAYAQATTYREHHTIEFWTRYGNSALKLGEKMGQASFLLKAISCYKNGLTLSISSSKEWLHLAKAIHALYRLTLDNDHYVQANECFAIAARLASENPTLWHQWAQLIFENGLSFKDEANLKLCIEKCHRGIQADPTYYPLLILWSQALAKLGALTDALPLIDEAQNKIQEVRGKGVAKESQILYLEGIVAMAKGDYFQDPDNYYQATEKFQQLLSSDRTDHHLWHALGKGFLSAAELDSDSSSFECACRFFNRALYLFTKPHYHYDYGLCLIKYGEFLQEASLVEKGIYHLQMAIESQQNAAYTYPDWLFNYAYALDLMGDFTENETYYAKALETSLQVLALDPSFPSIHYQLALTYSHYAQFASSLELFNRAFSHYHIAHQHDKENGQLILDWAITLGNCGDLCAKSPQHIASYLQKAECKMIQAIRLGNVHAYYSIGCLYSLMGEIEPALKFLEKAHRFEGLPPLEELLEDDWLENLRDTPRFRSLIDHLKNSTNHEQS